MQRLSDAIQESYVEQGLALGVLADGVDALPSGKLDFEFALSHAWGRFPHAPTFPRILSRFAADAYYSIPLRSERRRGPLLAAWSKSQSGWLVPYVWNEGWDVEESGHMLGDWSGVPWSAWQDLGARLVSYYRERGKL